MKSKSFIGTIIRAEEIVARQGKNADPETGELPIYISRVIHVQTEERYPRFLKIKINHSGLRGSYLELMPTEELKDVQVHFPQGVYIGGFSFTDPKTKLVTHSNTLETSLQTLLISEQKAAILQQKPAPIYEVEKK